MQNDPDPALDALRALWKEESQEPVLPPEALDDTDADTRAVVAALQDAWRVETPLNEALTSSIAAKVEARARRRARRRAAARFTFGAAAAAAALLAIRLGTGESGGRPTVHPTQDTAAAVADAEPPYLNPSEAPTTPAAAEKVATEAPAPTVEDSFAVQQLTQRPDGVEFRSGNVRVVLVQPMR